MASDARACAYAPRRRRVECDSDPDSAGACSYYQWFLYLLGNLVGLGTPLTDNSPSSSSYIGEIIDLLISTWSLSIAGTLYGARTASPLHGAIDGPCGRLGAREAPRCSPARHCGAHRTGYACQAGVIGGLFFIETARSYTDRTFINARFFAMAEYARYARYARNARVFAMAESA